MKDTNFEVIRKVCRGIIGFSLLYLTFRLVPVDVLVVSGVLIVTLAVLLKVVWSRLRERGTWFLNLGIVNLLPPKLQNALLHKSIFDIYSDLLYFPFISEIIKAFVSPLFYKPTP